VLQHGLTAIIDSLLSHNVGGESRLNDTLCVVCNRSWKKQPPASHYTDTRLHILYHYQSYVRSRRDFCTCDTERSHFATIEKTPSRRAMHNLKLHHPFVKTPCSNSKHRRYHEKAEHKRTTEYDGMISPRRLRSYVHSCNDHRPGQHPQQIRAQCLEEVPSRHSR
jgi:hypothetical protein